MSVILRNSLKNGYFDLAQDKDSPLLSDTTFTVLIRTGYLISLGRFSSVALAAMSPVLKNCILDENGDEISLCFQGYSVESVDAFLHFLRGVDQTHLTHDVFVEVRSLLRDLQIVGEIREESFSAKIVNDEEKESKSNSKFSFLTDAPNGDVFYEFELEPVRRLLETTAVQIGSSSSVTKKRSKKPQKRKLDQSYSIERADEQAKEEEENYDKTEENINDLEYNHPSDVNTSFYPEEYFLDQKIELYVETLLEDFYVGAQDRSEETCNGSLKMEINANKNGYKFSYKSHFPSPDGLPFNSPRFCRGCSSPIKTLKGLINHHVRHTKGFFECKICSEKIICLYLMQSHILQHKPMEISCDSCGDCFRDPWNFSRHAHNVHSNKTGIGRPTIEKKALETCTRCEKEVKNLQDHLVQEHGETYNCKECNWSSLIKSKLTRHIYTKHSKASMEAVVCQHCGKTLKNRKHLHHHISNNHRSDRILHCEKCDFVTCHREGMRVHMEKHENITYCCEECGKTFKRKKSYNSHKIMKHTKEEDKKYTCEYCGKKFMKTNMYKGHVNIHLGIKPFKCRVCDRTYRLESNRSMHEKEKHPEFYENEKLKNAKKREMRRMNKFPANT